MKEDCIFCKIAAGAIPADVVVETEHALVFKDIRPTTPVHCLAIPKRHIATLNEAGPDEAVVLGDVCLAAAKAAARLGIADEGYRLVANTNRNAGQEVFHVHFHLLGGRKFGWPPG
jgi:histidine triad (HIT) family protein